MEKKKSWCNYFYWHKSKQHRYTKFGEKIEGDDKKIPHISGLVTAIVLTTNIVKRKLPVASGLVKKTDYDTKIGETEKKIFDYNHAKYIATQKFNNLTADNFAAGFKETA